MGPIDILQSTLWTLNREMDSQGLYGIQDGKNGRDAFAGENRHEMVPSVLSCTRYRDPVPQGKGEFRRVAWEISGSLSFDDCYF